MVTDEKIYNAALIRYRLGIALIWFGVLTWLPFMVLRIAGEKPSLIWYLPFDLLGVIGGARLRAVARKELGQSSPKKNYLQMIGHGAIFAGILVWIPYFYLKATAQPAEVMNYLPYHLVGVLGGAVLLVVNFWLSKKQDDDQGDLK